MTKSVRPDTFPEKAQLGQRSQGKKQLQFPAAKHMKIKTCQHKYNQVQKGHHCSRHNSFVWWNMLKKTKRNQIGSTSSGELVSYSVGRHCRLAVVRVGLLSWGCLNWRRLWAFEACCCEWESSESPLGCLWCLGALCSKTDHFQWMRSRPLLPRVDCYNASKQEET